MQQEFEIHETSRDRQIEKSRATYSFQKRNDIVEGCTINTGGDVYSESVAEYKSHEEALADIKGRKTEVSSYMQGRPFDVVEFAIVEYEREYDEDGDFDETDDEFIDYREITEMPELNIP